MCNSIDIQRAVTLERCKALFLGGATLEHVLGQAWNAGFCEADRDTGATSDAEFDRRVDEINREVEAIESGSVELSVCYCWIGGRCLVHNRRDQSR